MCFSFIWGCFAKVSVIETHITRYMLERAEKILLSNALRGVFEADLVVKE